MGRQGMVVFDGADELLVLKNVKWGLLTWPLKRLSDDSDRHVKWQLDVGPDSQGCTWHCVLAPDAWSGWPVQIVWDDFAGIALRSTLPEREPLLQTCLRHSNSMVFADLAWLARQFVTDFNPNGKSRAELLMKLGELFGMGSLICELDQKAKVQLVKNEDMISDLLKRMDQDEKTEFNALEEKSRSQRGPSSKSSGQIIWQINEKRIRPSVKQGRVVERGVAKAVGKDVAEQKALGLLQGEQRWQRSKVVLMKKIMMKAHLKAHQIRRISGWRKQLRTY